MLPLRKKKKKKKVDEDSRMRDKQKKSSQREVTVAYSFCSLTLLIRRWQLPFTCYWGNIRMKEVEEI